MYRMGSTPAIGGGSSNEELARPGRAAGELVLGELGDEPEPPPLEFQPHDHATATAAASKQYMGNARKTKKPYCALIALSKEGIFQVACGGGVVGG